MDNLSIHSGGKQSWLKAETEKYDKAVLAIQHGPKLSDKVREAMLKKAEDQYEAAKKQSISICSNMNFNLAKSTEILSRTPDVLDALLGGLSEEWIINNEGENTWSPFDVLGHLIEGENSDWIVRMELILSDKTEKIFTPFDRFAQFEKNKGKSIEALLGEFRELRTKNLELLKSKHLTEADLDKTALHPALGRATLRQLLSTWAVHDLGHIAQITRVMAKQYKEEVGPWRAYLPVLDR